jgi:flagellar biosynthetic protein FliQ
VTASARRIRPARSDLPQGQLANMNESILTELARRAIMVALELSLPILMVTLIVGVAVSLFQAVTQVQEMTLTFVPKVFAVIAALVILGPWMLQLIVGFTVSLITGAPSLIR